MVRRVVDEVLPYDEQDQHPSSDGEARDDFGFRPGLGATPVQTEKNGNTEDDEKYSADDVDSRKATPEAGAELGLERFDDVGWETFES